MIKIYGKNCINEAIRAKANIEVFLDDSIKKKDQNFTSMLNDKKIMYSYLPKDKMNSIFGNKHQGYGAYRSNYKIYEFEELDFEKSGGRILILDGIQDPHNLGAIIRSVDAFGVDAIILPKNRSVSITEAVAHVSTGAIEYVKICYVNSLSVAITRLKDLNYWIVGTDAMGSENASNIDRSLNLGIIIGSEGFGISKTLLKQVDFLIRIPMIGHVNSLNASVSAGIVLHDLC